MKQRPIVAIIIAVVAIAAILVTSYDYWYPWLGGGYSNVVVLDFHADNTLTGALVGGSWLLSGHIINDGTATSNIVRLQMTVTSDQSGGVIYQPVFSPIPAILAPKQEGTISFVKVIAQ